MLSAKLLLAAGARCAETVLGWAESTRPFVSAALTCACLLLAAPSPVAFVGNAWAGSVGAKQVLGTVPGQLDGGESNSSFPVGDFQGAIEVTQAPPAARTSSGGSGFIQLAQISEQDGPTTEIRIWPPGQPIRLGYRLNGSYSVLRQRLREVGNRGYGQVNWGPAFESIAEIDVEALFLQRVKKFSELTGLDIAAERFNFFDRWADFDMCFDLYLSDRVKDLRSFPCLQGLERRLGSESERSDVFTRLGLSSTYGRDNKLLGSGCLAAYSAYTFKEEIGRDFFHHIQKRSRFGRLSIFSELVGESIGGAIMADSVGLFGRLREYTGHTSEKDSSRSCRQTLRNTYRGQLERTVDDCLANMTGFPLSSVSPDTIISRPDAPELMNLRSLPLLPIGSANWVGLAAIEGSREYQDTARFRILEQHKEKLVKDLYRNTKSEEELDHFKHKEIEGLVKSVIEQNATPERVNLYSLIEEDCLGTK